MKHMTISGGCRTDARAPMAPREHGSAVRTPTGKTALFNDLRAARRSFDLSASALHLLWALINTHRGELPEPGEEGDPVIVFASNARLASWVGDVSERTITRNLGRLERAGMIARRYSANGKRYARRDWKGRTIIAFGVDISPFFTRSKEIHAAARELRDQEDALTILRERILNLVAHLRHRDARRAEQVICEAMRLVRRVPRMSEFQAMIQQLETLLSESSAEKMSATDRQTVRHKEDKSKDSFVEQRQLGESSCEDVFPQLTRALERLCTQSGASGLPAALGYLAVSEGIPEPTWRTTLERVGQGAAMACLGYLMQRRERIRHPRPYLQALVGRLEAGSITINALLQSPPHIRHGRPGQRARASSST